MGAKKGTGTVNNNAVDCALFGLIEEKEENKLGKEAKCTREYLSRWMVPK